MYTIPTHSAHCPRYRALTLIELCVCLSGISLLVAVAAPTLRSARQTSQLTACQHKLGRIQQATLIYAAADPDENAIPIGLAEIRDTTYTSPYSYGGRSGQGPTLDANNSVFGGSSLFLMGSPHRPLNAVLYKHALPQPPVISGFPDWSFDTRLDLRAYDCPADVGFPGMHQKGWKQTGLSSYQYFGTSYAAATMFIWNGPGSVIKSASIWGHAVSRIPVPSATLSYYESAAQYALYADNPSLDQTGCSWPFSMGSLIAHGWHGSDFRFNVAAVDGSVANVEMRGYGRAPAGTVCSPQVVCTCITVRFGEWRLDVGPASLVPTAKVQMNYDPNGIFGIVQ